MTKRILSLDGGGTWALLQSMALRDTYLYMGKEPKCRTILNDFDLVVANSGGSLMLAAMLEYLDDDIRKVTDLFLNEKIRTGVFYRYKWWEYVSVKGLLSIAGLASRYKAERKEAGLLQALPGVGNIPMCEVANIFHIRPDLVICGYDFDRDRAKFFRSNQDSAARGATNREHYRIVDAINASSNAPILYFDRTVKVAFVKDGEGKKVYRYWDGAMGANNNPVLVGITELKSRFPEEEIEVLSIGTGNNFLPMDGAAENNRLIKERPKDNLTESVKKSAQLVLSEPPDAATYMAHIFLGGSASSGDSSRVIRMNAQMRPEKENGTWVVPKALDTHQAKQFLRVLELDMDAVDQEDAELVHELGDWWLSDRVPNQPIRMDGGTLECEIGHERYTQAREAWVNLVSE